MFDLKRPCANCPWLKAKGSLFGFSRARIEEIINAPAFSCHKTVDHDATARTEDENGETSTVFKPSGAQQCAGLIAMLWKDDNRMNQITQVAHRIIGYDPSVVIGDDVYDSVKQAIRSHASESE